MWSTDLCVRVVKFDGAAVVPSRATVGSAGFDLHAIKRYSIAPFSDANFIETGIGIEMPPGMVAFIRPRSSLNKNSGLRVLDGTIDSDYRGPIGVLMDNHTDGRWVIESGQRIAQMVFQWVCQPAMVEVEALGGTARGAGGFGSTGI